MTKITRFAVALPLVAAVFAIEPGNSEARTKSVVKYGAIGVGAAALYSMGQQSAYAQQPHYGYGYGYAQPAYAYPAYQYEAYPAYAYPAYAYPAYAPAYPSYGYGAAPVNFSFNYSQSSHSNKGRRHY